MTTINNIKEELDIHFGRVDAVLPEIKSYLPFKPEDFEDIEKVKAIDSFVYRFTKIQDRMGEKLFPTILKELQEYKSNMAFIDILNKLERLEVINSSDEWIDFRKLRNSLAHEYSNNQDEIIEAILMALQAYEEMKRIYKKCLERVSIL